jgi:peroxiredoxin
VEHELTQLGYQIVALSPDKPSAEGLEGPARLFSDADMDAARAYGLSYRVGDSMLEKLRSYGIDILKASGRNHKQLPVPAVFVIGADGKVAFQYVNPDHSQRLHPDVLLAAARTGGGRNPRAKGGE